jgi:hypothetical protein
MWSQIIAFKNLKAIAVILPETILPTHVGLQIWAQSILDFLTESIRNGELAYELIEQLDRASESMEKYNAVYRPGFKTPAMQAMDTSGNLLRGERDIRRDHSIRRGDTLLCALEFFLSIMGK